MRLNFSGVERGRDPRGHPPDRRGRQGAGRAVRHADRRAARRSRADAVADAASREADGGRSSRLPAPRRARAARHGGDERVAVLKGGSSLERQVSLRSGARVEDALERLGHEVDRDRRRRGPVRRLRDERPTSPSSRCTVATARTARSRSCSRSSASLHGVGRARPACAAMDKVLTKHLLREAGMPTPEFFAFNQTAFRELGAADALPAIEERLEFPIVVKPSSQGSALGIKFARVARRRAGRAGRRVLLRRRRCCSSATSTVATSPSRCWTARRAEALPVVEAVPQRARTSTTSRPATRSAAPSSSARRSCRMASTRAGAGAGAADLRAARLLRLRPRRPDARRATGEPLRPGGQPDPRPDRDEPAAAGRGGGGIGFDELVGRILDSALARAERPPVGLVLGMSRPRLPAGPYLVAGLGRAGQGATDRTGRAVRPRRGDRLGLGGPARAAPDRAPAARRRRPLRSSAAIRSGCGGALDPHRRQEPAASARTGLVVAARERGLTVVEGAWAQPGARRRCRWSP